MAERIKWGVIGSGGIARRRTIPEGLVTADNARLVIVHDINAKANAEVANQFSAKAAASIDELLKADIDAVYVATPANMHCEQVLACAKAGKNVLCEKPLGLTVKEAEKMIDACRDADVLLGTALMMRFHTQHRAALEMVKQGKLGKLTYGRAQLSCWYPPIEGAWRQNPATGGGGSLIDMGGHCIDLMEMYFGKPKKVNCFINTNVQDYQSEDSAVAMLFFENGAIATVDNFFCIPDSSSKNVLEIYGSKGSILAKGTIGQTDAGQMVAYLEQSDTDYDAQQNRPRSCLRQEDAGAGIVIAPKPYNTYRAEIEQFSQAVIDGGQPTNNAEIGLQNQKVLAACYESAKTGKVIDL